MHAVHSYFITRPRLETFACFLFIVIRGNIAVTLFEGCAQYFCLADSNGKHNSDLKTQILVYIVVIVHVHYLCLVYMFSIFFFPMLEARHLIDTIIK